MKFFDNVSSSDSATEVGFFGKFLSQKLLSQSLGFIPI